MALIHCSYSHAKLIAEAERTPDAEEFDNAAKAFLDGLEIEADEVRNEDELINVFMGEFREIKRKGSTSRFYNYLKRRHFDDPEECAYFYDLRACTTGIWQDRIIIPVYQNETLVTWTGRAIAPTSKAPRYKALSPRHAEPVKALELTTNTLWGYDDILEGGRSLIITEGPFDALKLDWYGYPIEVRATCLFGLNMSMAQHSLIAEVVDKFDNTYLLLDREAIEADFTIHEELTRYGVQRVQLPTKYEDPGSMTRLDTNEFLSQF